MSNIEKFDEYVGRIFGILYESFPIPIKLSVEKILDLDDTQSVFNNPEFEHETLLAMHTISWLSESKYIYTKKVYDTYCEDVGSCIQYVDGYLKVIISLNKCSYDLIMHLGRF